MTGFLRSSWFARVTAFTCFTTLLFATGCGGGSSSGGSGQSSGSPSPISTPSPDPSATPIPAVGGKTKARFQIGWPGRSRSVNSPESALSAKISLTPTSGDTTPIVWFAQRDESKMLSYSQDVDSPDASCPVGVPLNFVVTFYAEPTSATAKTVVGTASAQVTLNSYGTLPDVAVDTTIKKLVVLPGQTLEVNEATTLVFTAYDANEAIVPISQGSVFWTNVETNNGILDLYRDGTATGRKIGNQKVKVFFNGSRLESESVIVAVVAIKDRIPTEIGVKLPTQGGTGKPSKVLVGYKDEASLVFYNKSHQIIDNYTPAKTEWVNGNTAAITLSGQALTTVQVEAKAVGAASVYAMVDGVKTGDTPIEIVDHASPVSVSVGDDIYFVRKNGTKFYSDANGTIRDNQDFPQFIAAETDVPAPVDVQAGVSSPTIWFRFNNTSTYTIKKGQRGLNLQPGSDFIVDKEFVTQAIVPVSFSVNGQSVTGYIRFIDVTK